MKEQMTKMPLFQCAVSVGIAESNNHYMKLWLLIYG